MSGNDTSRLSRLMAIHILLQSRQLITAQLIAEKFGVSKRTIYRDIRALEEAGVPIVTIEGKGYSLVQGYTIPPVMFSEEETNALITAEKIIETEKDLSFVHNYTSAITKIKALLKHNTKAKTELLAERMQIRSHPRATTSNYLSALQQAITGFIPVAIVYISETQQQTSRQIEPLALLSTPETKTWLLLAYCRLRNDIRYFRLDRIQSLTKLSGHFPPHNFNLQEYLAECQRKYLPPP